jgi:dihydrolipoamide dehydrogenase
MDHGDPVSLEYDVIVIGAGAVGENAAAATRREGLTTVLIESELVGGECSYWACMPSKALLRPGQTLESARRAPGADAAVTGEIDADAALARRDAIAYDWDDSSQVEWLESVEVDLVRGHARFTGPREVAVEHRDGPLTRLTAKSAVVVATGSAADMPSVEGLADIRWWDNRDITSAKDVPRRLLIIGAGAVGVEMAEAWKALGSEEVTLVQRADRVLDREEPFVGEEVGEALVRAGVRLIVSGNTTRVARPDPDGPVTAWITVRGDEEEVVTADEVLIATGRRPRTDDLGLETIGLEPGESLVVDDRLRVTGIDGDWLYAVGDVNGRTLFTHSGKYQGRIVGRVIAGHDARAWGDRAALPRVVFTSPQVAAVGLIERAAREQGIAVQVVRHDIGKVAGASTLGRGYEGTCQLVIDADRGVIVGATFVGPYVGELLHSATVAIVGEVPLGTLWHAIPSYPTLSEVWLRLLEAYRDEFGVEFD